MKLYANWVNAETRVRKAVFRKKGSLRDVFKGLDTTIRSEILNSKIQHQKNFLPTEGRIHLPYHRRGAGCTKVDWRYPSDKDIHSVVKTLTK